MKLNEIKSIEVIQTEASANIKGGGRDTRNDPYQPVSSVVIIFSTPKPKS